MRIVAFGDLHMSVQKCHIIDHISEADTVIATGDLTNYGGIKEAKQVLEQLLAINPNILALIGNLDNFEINDYLDQLKMNLHGQARLIQGKICVTGVGGSNITPFSTPTEYTEQELTEILMQAHHQGQEYISLGTSLHKRKIPTLLISHSPPYGTKLDMLTNGRHVGSTAVRTFIENYQPDLCITGHIHESRGEDTLGKTHIINPGMLQHGGWVDISLHSSTLSATLQ